MVDRTLPQLTNSLTADGVAYNDLWLVRDTSATEDKKITTAEAAEAFVGYVNVKHFGAVGDGVTDDIAAFEAAIAAIAGSAAHPHGAGIIFVPRGNYVLSRTLVFDYSIEIRGEVGSGSWGTRLMFPAGVAGIHVRETGDADGGQSIIKGLMIHAQGKTSAVHGITIAAFGVCVEHCVVYGFKGNGIHIVADTFYEDSNANCFRLYAVQSRSNDGDGVYVQGGDANAGTGYSVMSSGNAGWGIRDNSFLGNTWVGCLTEDNGLGTYNLEGDNNRSVLLGCYSEGGQPPGVFGQTAMSVSGIHDPGFTAPAVVVNAVGSALYMECAVKSAGDDGTDGFVRTLGGDNDNGTILSFTHEGHSAEVNRLFVQGKDIVWDYAHLGGPGAAFLISGPDTTMTFGRSAVAPHAFWPLRLFVGTSSGGARWVSMEDAAPTTGAHAVGEIVFNNAVAVGQPNGWRCTVAGTPGTWVAMANL